MPPWFAPLCIAVSWACEDGKKQKTLPLPERFTGQGEKLPTWEAHRCVLNGCSRTSRKGRMVRDGQSRKSSQSHWALGPEPQSEYCYSRTQAKTQGTLGWLNRTCLRGKWSELDWWASLRLRYWRPCMAHPVVLTTQYCCFSVGSLLPLRPSMDAFGCPSDWGRHRSSAGVQGTWEYKMSCGTQESSEWWTMTLGSSISNYPTGYSFKWTICKSLNLESNSFPYIHIVFLHLVLSFTRM